MIRLIIRATNSDTLGWGYDWIRNRNLDDRLTKTKVENFLRKTIWKHGIIILPPSALPNRTGISELTDNELLLFDMLFDSNANATQMSSSVYAEHMNCEYNHTLDDETLQRTLDSLTSRKLIHPVGNSKMTDSVVYSLTGTGGKLWEIERKPDWLRYVATSQKALGCFPTASIVALCIDEQIGRLCLGAMFASGIITPTKTIRVRELHSRRLVSWKTFSPVYALRCQTSDHVNHWHRSVDLDVYEHSRCWWRSISELLN